MFFCEEPGICPGASSSSLASAWVDLNSSFFIPFYQFIWHKTEGPSTQSLFSNGIQPWDPEVTIQLHS